MVDLTGEEQLAAERADEARELEAVRRLEAAKRQVGFGAGGEPVAPGATGGGAPRASAEGSASGAGGASGRGSGAAGGDEPAEPATGEVPPLPHWTEPPTGAVPAIFADDDSGEEVDDDLDAWATLSGSQPRFRAEGADWAEADFSEDLSGEHERLGALSEAGPVDEDAEFAQAFAERRRRRPGRRPARAAAETAGTAAASAAAASREAPAAEPEPEPVTTPPAPAPKARRARPVAPPPRRAPEPELAPPGPAQARDLPTAIMTAATIVIVALVCFQQRTWTALLAAVIVGFASVEFCNALRTKGLRPATLVVLVASASMPLAAKHYGIGAYPVYLALVVVFSMLWFLWRVTPGRPALGVATTVLAFAYVGGLGGFAGLLLTARDGIGLILGVVICAVAYDVFGFFFGSQFGRSRIAPNVSPNKSVEGTVAGILASIVLGALIVGRITPWSTWHGFLLGLFVGFAALFGDLSESMLKRDLGLKDFGTLLPGHGGVLDRFDALLFCLPVAYYLAVYLKIG